MVKKTIYYVNEDLLINLDAEKFSFIAGQFGEYSVFGEGESTFCVASSPTRKGYMECTFRKAGSVTNAMANLEEGDTVGFRGPYRNTFPIEEWEERPDIRLITTVDPGGQTTDWKGETGFVPMVLEKVAPSSENTIAILCGPPVMIKFTMPVLKKLGFQDKDIYTTLENRMKCGFGKCGRCNVGNVFVCKDGPVFSYEQILTLPEEY